MAEDEKARQQSKVDTTAYSIELRQLRMEEKAMRKIYDECKGQLTQLQVKSVKLFFVFSEFITLILS